MKSVVAIPVISFLTLTSTVNAAPKATPTASVTGLSDKQWSAIKDYQHSQTTKSEYSSVNSVLATAGIPAATKAKEESDFRNAALATDKPELPAYIKDTNSKASAYLSSYYLAQASIINKGVDKKDVQANGKTSSDVAQLLPDVTSSSTPAKTEAKATTTSKSDKPTSTGTKKPSTTAKATKGQDPAIALKSSSSGTGSTTSTGVKPLPTSINAKASSTKTDSNSTGTASSSSSTGAAVMAQPTGVMKMAGVGMLGVAGMAAFL